MPLLTLSAGAALRAATLAGRFILLLAVARHLGLADLGVFGVVTASIATAVLLLGLDFYAFSNREIAAAEPRRQVRLLVSQAFFHGSSYVVLLPAVALFVVLGVIPESIALWWMAILVAEHLATELYRVLIVLGHSFAANAALFLRAAAWGLAAAALVSLVPDLRSLRTVWIAWLAGCGASIALALWTIRYLPWRHVQPHDTETAWIRRGTSIMLPFLVASLSLKTIEYGDRFFLSRLVSAEALGQYTFFASVANSIQALVHSSVATVFLPRLLRARQAGDASTYAAERRRMLVLTFLMTGCLAALLVAGLRPLLDSLRVDPAMFRNTEIFWALLLANALMVVSWVAHYDLYVNGHDRHIVAANVCGAVCAAGLQAVLIPRYGVGGAAAATVLGVTMMLLLKTRSARAPQWPSMRPVGRLSVAGEPS